MINYADIFPYTSGQSFADELNSRFVAIKTAFNTSVGTPPNVIKYRGAYDAATAYVANDIVSSGGGKWLALAGSTNSAPVEGVDWTSLGGGGTGGDMVRSVYDANFDGVIDAGALPSRSVNAFVGSGASNAAGLVPAPGATAGTAKFLREDGSFAVPPGATGTNATQIQGVNVAPTAPTSGQSLVFDGTSYAPATLSSSGGGDMFSTLTQSEIAVTTTATLTLGRMHVCSGTSANYTVTLPTATGNAGKFVGVRMANALTKLVTVAGASGQLIDAQNTRAMWAQESAILLCDGTGWTKISGKSRAFSAKMFIGPANQLIDSATLTKINLNQIAFNSLSMCDTTNKRINILRGNNYRIVGTVVYGNVSQNVSRITAYTERNNDGITFTQTETSGLTGAYPFANTIEKVALATGNFLELKTFHNASSQLEAVGALTGSSCRLEVTEEDLW